MPIRSYYCIGFGDRNWLCRACQTEWHYHPHLYRYDSGSSVFVTECILSTNYNPILVCHDIIYTAGDLKNSLFQAGVDITQFPGLGQMHTNNRIKEAVVHSMSSLIHIISILQKSLNGEQCLIIFEGLNPLVLSQKVRNYSLLHITCYAYSISSICVNYEY
jgi:hypothetical protein